MDQSYQPFLVLIKSRSKSFYLNSKKELFDLLADCVILKIEDVEVFNL